MPEAGKGSGNTIFRARTHATGNSGFVRMIARDPAMQTDSQSDSFYANVTVFRDFTRVLDPTMYKPLPDDWVIGVADVVQSTKAIRENRYKAVNMAGAAVIVAVTNALEGRDFPFVFGGDGASFAVPAFAADLARHALAATATWVKEELDLTLRVRHGAGCNGALER